MLTHQSGQRTSFQPPPMPATVFDTATVFTLRDAAGTKVVCVNELAEGVVDGETPVLVYRLDEEDQGWTPELEPMHVEVERSYRVILSLTDLPFLNQLVIEFDLESTKWVPLYDPRSNGMLFHLAHIDASRASEVVVYTQTLDKSIAFAHVYA